MKPILFGTMAGGGASFDPDAQAFITAAGITDPTQQGAIDDLVVGLKADSLWTKMSAIYPFVGGTATTHKYNLIDPQDTNGAFRLTFAGGWTHSANGALPNGSTGYANTHYVPATSATVNDFAMTYYSRTNVTTGGWDMGGGDGLGASTVQWGFNEAGLGGFLCDIPSTRTTGSPANAQGLFTVSRTTVPETRGYRNALDIGNTGGGGAITGLTWEIYLAALNTSGVAGGFGTHEVAFASIGTGLTGGNVSSLYTLVQAFQTTLGRQV